MPGWVGPAVAVSLIIIAGSFVVIAVAIAMSARQASQEMAQLTRLVDSLRADIAPAMAALSQIAGRSEKLVDTLTGEAEALANGSRRVRAAVGDRLARLEAMYDVLEGEIEQATLDVATTIRTVRTGHGWYTRIRRLVRGRRYR